MGLEERKRPDDPAPDWNDQSYGGRVNACVTQLLLFNFITDKEARYIWDRMDKWIKQEVQNNG